jgi:hypothetical protein
MNNLSFHERPSFALTWWRRLTFSSFLLLVSTALLSKAVFGSDHISWFIEKYNLQKGLTLSPAQLSLLLLNLRENIIGIHVAMGYLLTILLALGALTSLGTTGAKNRRQSALRTGGLLACTGMLGTMASTGIWMALNQDLEILAPQYFEQVKQVHQMAYHTLLTGSALYKALDLPARKLYAFVYQKPSLAITSPGTGGQKNTLRNCRSKHETC